MTGRVEGKVAFITGAARGQGRSHAITLAREGADIIAVDICAQIGTVPYPMATPEDLAQTVKEVQAAGRQIVATVADVRDYDALKEALDDGVARLGRLDIVSANAGITSYGRAEDLAEQTWRDVIDVDLTGVWHAVKGRRPRLTRCRVGEVTEGEPSRAGASAVVAARGSSWASRSAATAVRISRRSRSCSPRPARACSACSVSPRRTRASSSHARAAVTR